MQHTICLITSRDEPKFDWLFDSLHPQVLPGDEIEIIIVDGQRNKRTITSDDFTVRHLPVKPNVWQGASRLTKEEWWSAAASRNTGICACRTEWISFLDDRCILSPNWLQCVREAQQNGYGMFGSYEKRKNVKVALVDDDYYIPSGEITGEDSRADYVKKHRGNAAPVKCPGEWSFGCNITVPLEWCLAIGGFEEEHCDGLSMEDVIFGKMLENAGYPLFYDHRALMTEDRTPGETGPVMIRKDKGITPNDKSHAALHKLSPLKYTLNNFDIRQVRADVLAGKPFPPPAGSAVDWYDGQPLSEM